MAAIFENLNIYIVPLNILSKRCELLERNVRLYDGTVAEEVDSTPRPTHILFSEDFYDKKLDLEAVLKKINIMCEELGTPHTKVMSTAWLCQCVKEKKLVDTGPFEFRPKVLELEAADTVSEVLELKAADTVSEVLELKVVDTILRVM